MAEPQPILGLAKGLVKLAAGVATTVGVLQASLFTVDGGQRVVMFDRFRGVLDNTVGEGTHFRIPWVQTPHIYSVRTRPKSISTFTGTRDLQTVNLTLRVLYKPRVELLPQIHQRLGVDYDERVLPSIGNEVLKSVVAQVRLFKDPVVQTNVITLWGVCEYNADQLLTMREKVSRAIRDTLTRRASEFNIILDDVSITHLTFGREFSEAIERKQVAYQEAERSKFLVMRAEHEKKAAVIRAEGESEAAKLISDALQSGEGLIILRRIEAARDIAESLSQSQNVTYLPGGGNVLMNLQR